MAWFGKADEGVLSCTEQSELKDTEGLKLSLDVNLDIEIELKASIRGDLTLSLL